MSRAQLTSTVEQNTGGAVAPFVAGKNKIINGDFGIWQRGTSFSTVNTYTADRWRSNFDGTGATRTVSQQTFTPGTAPVVGYEGQFFFRFNKSVGGSGGTIDYVIQQLIEDCRVLAGQTVTLSFWAKSDASRTVNAYIQQNLGTGGLGSPAGQGYSSFSLTTSWQRFTMTVTLPSLAGMTIGTSSFLTASLYWSNTNLTGIIDIWGVQLEAGSVATPFTTATGTLQGELAACQRYCWVMGINVDWPGQYYSTSTVYGSVKFPSTMRAVPSLTVSTAGAINVFAGGSGRTSTAITSDALSTDTGGFGITTAATGTAGWGTSNRINSGATATWSAEL